MKKNIAYFFSLLFLILFSNLLFSANQTVTDNGDSGTGTLRQAIIDVGTGETISFNLSSGNETITISSELSLSHDKSFTIDGSNTSGSGTEVTVQVTTPGTSTYRVFFRDTYSTTITLKNMTIKGGDISSSSGSDAYGGAIYNATGAMNLESVTIDGSKAAYGGGIVSNGAGFVIDQSTIKNCIATAWGGGIRANATNTISISNSTFDNNTAANYGGGISLGSNLTSITITNCTVINNSSNNDGGGINMRASGTITNCTVVNNSSGFYGGGINMSASGTISYCTIAENTSGDNRGGGITLGGSGETQTIEGTILANNTGYDLYDASPGIIDQGDNIIETYSGGTFTAHASTITGEQSSLWGTGISATPSLGDNNTLNGPQTIEIISGSVAIDAGSAGNAPAKDQRGYDRDSTPDIGAFEKVQYPSITVTSNSNSGAGTLRQAILDIADGGEITFNLSPGNETITISSELSLSYDRGFTIDGSNTSGSGTEVTVQVTTPGTSTYRVFFRDTYSTTITLKNMTIKGGDISSFSGSAAYGGSIYNATGAMNLESITIDGSKAAYGGGIVSNGAGFVIDQSTIKNCIATIWGGGIRANATNTISISKSTFDNNTAANYGGGISLGGNLTSITITNCTVVNNTSSNDGGGINIAASGTITNCTVVNNSSNAYGGGINMSASGTISYCTIAENTSVGNKGGGISLGGSGETQTIEGTILANNTGYDLYDLSGGFSDQGNNIMETYFGPTYTQHASTITGDQSNLWGTGISATPSLGDNNTLYGTQTIAIISGSVAIDAGSAGNAPAKDQRGYDRDDGTPDIGAYELRPDLVSYSGGSGTSGDPYQIATTDDLIELSNTSDDWGAYFKQTADISFNSDETQVDWDGDGSAGPTEGFSPIGNSTIKFTGSFNGQSKTISNLFINRSATNDVGLFGFLSGAAITNTNLADVDITGNTGVGGLAGQDESATTISGCTISGSTTIDGVTNVGGFIGNSNTSGNISDCNFSGIVSANNADAANSVGGFAGQKGGTGTISECSTSGTVNGNGSNHGGFVGWMNNGEIRRCYSTMAGVNTSTTQGRIGGFVGGHAYYASTSGQIYNCYATGSVTANSTTNNSGLTYGIGGFVGSYYGAGNNKIYYSYSTGAVSATSASSNVGGFSGEDFGGGDGAIDCFWDTETSGQATSTEGETGLTTADMKTESTFTNWNFTASTGIWEIQSGEYISYPYLQAITYDTPGTTPEVNPIPGLELEPYSGGSGTSGDPYQIATTEDLIELSNTSADWDKYFIQTADISFNSDETAVDWDRDGTATWDTEDQKGFSPIGNSTIKFTGSFIGQSNTITNLFIDRSATNDIGLFGFLSAATITNTNLAAVDITGNTGVGGLAGQDEGATTISGCTIDGSNTIDGVSHVGGFIGFSNTSGSISDCQFSGTVSADNLNAANQVGGFVGEKGGTGTISESGTSGTINGNGRNHGGFVGWMNNGEIRRCYSTMAVVNTSTTQGRIAGFAGGLAYYESTSGQIYNCYATGSVTANSTSNTSSFGIGGFVGSYYAANNNKIENSYSTGAVSATSASSYVGGFSGEEFTGSGGAVDCFWDTETSNQSSSAEIGDGETGKTTAEMKTESTFTGAGWDFIDETTNGSDNYWGINPTDNNGYPFLAWQGYTHGTPGLWNGTTNTDWATGTNWDNGSAPGASTDVSIPNVANDPVIATNVEVNDLTIESGAVLTISAGKRLTVNSTLTNNADISGLVLKSTAGGTAELINGTTGVKASVEQYLSANKWHYMGIPFTDNPEVVPAFKGLYLVSSDESASTHNSSDGWSYLTSTDNVSSGTGYGFYHDLDTTTTMSGTLNASEQTVSTTYSGSSYGWNLISNPFPCTVDWDYIRNNSGLSNVNDAIYVYDPASDSYATYVDGVSGGADTQDRYIAPMQGFFVRTTAAGSVTFNPSAKSTGTSSFKSETVEPIMRLTIRNSSEHSDNAVVRISPLSTLGFDGQYDAYKLLSTNSSTPEIYSQIDGVIYSINSIPEITEETVIPLKAKIKQDGQHTISLSELENYNSAYPVVLQRENGNFLAHLESEDYTFDAVAGETLKLNLAFTNSTLSGDGFTKNKIILSTYDNNIVLDNLSHTPGKVLVYNLSGQVLFRQDIAVDHLEIPVSKSGVYIVRVQSQKGSVFSGKAIINF